MTEKTAKIAKWSSIAAIAIAALLLMRALPLDEATKALGQWTDSLGAWGPVVFGFLYVIAAICFVPGSLLTLAAGAIFGLWNGFAVVSFSSVTAASCAFLISRYVARSKVESMAKSNERFGAIDAAIDEGGWKIVGLLRLSPAIPFSIQNYFFGLTNIKFWPYMLTSWVAMVPGTFLYVYLGHAAGAAAESDGKSVGEWALLAVGLVATIVVAAYVTHLAKKKLKNQTELKNDEAH